MNTPDWKPLDAALLEFLSEFERRSAEPDTDDGRLFAERFVVADPVRDMILGRDALVASLPHRRRMFADAGVHPARLVEATRLDLDPLHVLVRSDWDAGRDEAPPVRLESTFLIRRDPDGPRILAYLNHKDISAVLAGLT